MNNKQAVANTTETITTLDINPDPVLLSAVGKLECVIVIGTTKEGAEYFASSWGGTGQNLLMAELFKKMLLE